jgi:16S rRNA (guanine527-N7)-methyltransferase
MQTHQVIAEILAIGMEISELQAQRFLDYAHLLAEWNARFNLTAISEPSSVLTLHFVDSLTVLKLLPARQPLRLLDVGTGAGFPGLALRIARPDLDVTVIDSTAKKIAFCQEVIDRLALNEGPGAARALHVRSEEFAHDHAHRESYDVVTARAVAAMPTLAEYLLPFVKVGGLCVAMKGTAAAQEASDALAAIRALGGALNRIEPVTLPGVPDKRALIVIDKVARTLSKYPRAGGAPRNSPLK